MKFVPNVMWGDCGRKESMGVGQGGGGGGGRRLFLFQKQASHY